jgi:RNA polymerase sigma factor (sigma-70 family)
VSSEQDLVLGCLAGDESSYEELFNRYEARALRTAYALTGDRSEAEDAKQEGFVQAFRTIHRLAPGLDFGPWLYRSVVWAARNRARKARRWREAFSRSAAVAHGGGASGIDDLDVRGALVDALRGLPTDQREVLVLRFYVDLPEAEVATILGCPLGTVKSRAARGLRRLASSPGLAWRRSNLEGSVHA